MAVLVLRKSAARSSLYIGSSLAWSAQLFRARQSSIDPRQITSPSASSTSRRCFSKQQHTTTSIRSLYTSYGPRIVAFHVTVTIIRNYHPGSKTRETVGCRSAFFAMKQIKMPGP
jgi:hypothetical protein